MREVVMNKKNVIITILLSVIVFMSACGNSDYSSSYSSNISNSAVTGFSTDSSSASSVSFTNKYGTPTTICAHSGCSNYIASTGDTNCCTTHSNRCFECDKYIDEDALFCMDCLEKYSSSSQSSNSSETVSDWMKNQAVGKDYSEDDGGVYYCMGKNDTCPNTTRNAYDLYCDQCDPDGNNIEGRQ